MSADHPGEPFDDHRRAEGGGPAVPPPPRDPSADRGIDWLMVALLAAYYAALGGVTWLMIGGLVARGAAARPAPEVATNHSPTTLWSVNR